MNEEKLTLDSVIDEKKTLAELISEDFEKAKKKVFEKIKEKIIPDDEVLSACHIKRIIHDSVITQIAFDRVIRKDNVVYKKDTAKLEKILSELNTLEYGNDECEI